MAIICPDYNLLFIMTPRTGSTAIGELLFEELGGKYLPEDDVLDDKGHAVVQKKHTTANQLVQHGFLTDEQLRSLFVFGAVRNPFDSFVSLYTKKAMSYQHALDEPDSYVYRMKGYVEDMKFCKEHTFDEWVEHKFSVPLWKRVLGKGRRSLFGKYTRGINCVMRFETLHDDFRKAMQQAGVPKALTIPRVNVTTEREADYQRYYSDKSRKTMEYAFAEELDTLGYQF